MTLLSTGATRTDTKLRFVFEGSADIQKDLSAPMGVQKPSDTESDLK